jgi:hypothetical protein
MHTKATIVRCCCVFSPHILILYVEQEMVQPIVCLPQDPLLQNAVVVPQALGVGLVICVSADYVLHLSWWIQPMLVCSLPALQASDTNTRSIFQCKVKGLQNL